MISRLTAIAATFAVIATASLAMVANAHQDRQDHPGATQQVRTVQLERVVITARRAPQGAL